MSKQAESKQMATKGNKFVDESEKTQQKHSKGVSEQQISNNKKEQLSTPNMPYICGICGKGFDNLTSLKRHIASTGHKGGDAAYTKLQEPREEAVHKTTQAPSAEAEEAITEPLPDALQQLDTILTEHGIKRKAVVLRAMKLRDPEDLTELMFVLDDIGVNRSRQRRIISDYARWLGKRIPPQVVKALAPPNADQYVEPPEWRTGIVEPPKPQPQLPQSQPSSDTASLIHALAHFMSEMNKSNRPCNPTNPVIPPHVQEELRSLRSEVQTLRDQLHKSEMDALRRELESVKGELKELKNRPVDVEAKRLDILDKKLTELLDFFRALGRPPRRRLRPVVEEPNAEPSIAELRAAGIPVEFENEEVNLSQSSSPNNLEGEVRERR